MTCRAIEGKADHIPNNFSFFSLGIVSSSSRSRGAPGARCVALLPPSPCDPAARAAGRPASADEGGEVGRIE
ncbi:Uncharacterised protein [uncultured archaeon]|nr:Uncharacterised protein [uncultured archaeon]